MTIIHKQIDIPKQSRNGRIYNNSAISCSALSTSISSGGGGSTSTLIGVTTTGSTTLGVCAAKCYTGATLSYNTLIGYSANYSNRIGSANTVIGYSAGYSNTCGCGNVFIGCGAGYSETTSNKLYIANSNTTTPLIYGDFNTCVAKVNGTICGTCFICGVCACFTTTVKTNYLCGAATVRTPSVCASSYVCSPIITGSTKVCSPIICGTNCVVSPIVNASSCVKAPLISGTTVCGATIYGNLCGTVSCAIYANSLHDNLSNTNINLVYDDINNNSITLVSDKGYDICVDAASYSVNSNNSSCLSGVAGSCYLKKNSAITGTTIYASIYFAGCATYLTGCATSLTTGCAVNSACLGGTLAACYARRDAANTFTSSNKFQAVTGTTVYGSSCVCSPIVCATTCIRTATACATTCIRTATACATTSVNTPILCATNTTGYLVRENSGSGFGLYKNAVDNIGIVANGTERLTVFSGGYVSIGNTSTSYAKLSAFNFNGTYSAFFGYLSGTTTGGIAIQNCNLCHTITTEWWNNTINVPLIIKTYQNDNQLRLETDGSICTADYFEGGGIICATTCFAGSGAGLTGTASSLTVGCATSATNSSYAGSASSLHDNLSDTNINLVYNDINNSITLASDNDYDICVDAASYSVNSNNSSCLSGVAGSCYLKKNSAITGTTIYASTYFAGCATYLTGCATSLTAGSATNAACLGGTLAACYARRDVANIFTSTNCFQAVTGTTICTTNNIISSGVICGKGVVKAYRYGNSTALPAITLDKGGSYAMGIGADGTSMRIRYGAVDNMDGTAWIDNGGIQHYFDGIVYASTCLCSPLICSTGTITASNVREIKPYNLTEAANTCWDMNCSMNAALNLTASRCLCICNVTSGDTGNLKVVQCGSGSYCLTLPTPSKKVSGYAQSTAVGSVDILSFYYDGSAYYWTIGKNYT